MSQMKLSIVLHSLLSNTFFIDVMFFKSNIPDANGLDNCREILRYLLFFLLVKLISYIGTYANILDDNLL